VKPLVPAAFRAPFLVLLLLMAAFCCGQGFQQVTAVVPANVNLKDVKIIQRLGSQLPMDVEFKDQLGQSVTFGSMLHGRPALVLAIFYRCAGVCSIEMQNLAETLATMDNPRIGRDFDVIVVGINPKETPDLARAKLAQTIATYPKFKGTQAGWHFLTGTLSNIRSVTNKLGFFFTYDPVKDVVNHSAGVMFLTPTGAVSSYILGARYTVDGFRSDIQLAGKNQIGVKSPDIFFGCIHIDPLTGKRSIVIENVLKVAGVVTVTVLLLTLLTLSGKAKWGKKRSEDGDETDWTKPGSP